MYRTSPPTHPPPGHFHSSLVLRYSCIYSPDVHFQGCTFRSPALKWLRPSPPPFPSGETRAPLHFPKVAAAGRPHRGDAGTTTEPQWHFNSAPPFTSPHLATPPDLKCVPGKPDYADNFNELSAGERDVRRRCPVDRCFSKDH